LYAQHLQAAGVKVILKKYKGASHAFTHNGPQGMAEDAWNVMSNHLYKTFYSIRS
jgi:acetyl esterase